MSGRKDVVGSVHSSTGAAAPEHRSIQEREDAARIKRALRMKEKQLIEAEERAVEEQQENRMREDIRKKEKLIGRSKSRENEARERIRLEKTS